MADFEEAYKRTARFEGGYANHLNDKGGETYRGVARNYWPGWSGWLLVDSCKSRPDWPENIHDCHKWATVTVMLEDNARLSELVCRFYQMNFWNTICGEQIIDQRVANNIYDWEVNSGEGYPARASQHIVGVLVDGDIGPITVKAINEYNPDEFVKKFKEARRKFYLDIVAADPSQAVFLDGWLKRNDEA